VTAYIVSPQARQDLLDITGYIARDNLDAALHLRDRMFAAFELLASQPGVGRMRDDLVPAKLGVRFWPVGTYLVIYRTSNLSTQIVRVLSGYRDVTTILNQAPD
jgi:toxin ParE1/3/4